MDQQLSKQQVEKFKKALLEEKSRLEKEIAQLKTEDPFSDPERVVDNAAVDTDVREEIGHENIAAQISQLEATLKDINLALDKIEKGKYGYCEICGRLISSERLELVPYARFCVECQKKVD